MKRFFIRKSLKICPNGAVPSEPDSRDILSSGIIPQIKRKPEVFLPPFDLTISNQKNQPSCVGHSASTIKQYNEFKERQNISFDGDWIYNECKKVDNYSGNGTYLRTGMDILYKVGARPVGGGDDPSKYRIGGYARIDNLTPDSLKNHILVYGSAMVGFRGSNQGWQGNVVRPPKSSENVWGHCVALVGYERLHFIGQNSWGEDRHDKGLFKVPLDYMPFEGWVALTDRPNNALKAEDGGWVASEFITWKNGKLTATHNLNVRQEPTLRGTILKTIPRGTEVHLIDEQVIHRDRYTWRHIKLV
jgi:hypothetical protein